MSGWLRACPWESTAPGTLWILTVTSGILWLLRATITKNKRKVSSCSRQQWSIVFAGSLSWSEHFSHALLYTSVYGFQRRESVPCWTYTHTIVWRQNQQPQALSAARSSGFAAILSRSTGSGLPGRSWALLCPPFQKAVSASDVHGSHNCLHGKRQNMCFPAGMTKNSL